MAALILLLEEMGPGLVITAVFIGLPLAMGLLALGMYFLQRGEDGIKPRG